MPLHSPTSMLRIAVLAAVSTLPGCLTASLWRGYAWPEPTISVQWVREAERTMDGEIRASVPTMDNGVWWQGRGERWFLVARHDPTTEVAAAILDDPGFCTLRRATIDAERRCVDEDVRRADARLALALHVNPHSVAEVVPDRNVPRAVRARLAHDRRNAFLDVDGAGPPLPAAFRECARRLTHVDIGWLAGIPDAAHAAAWMFVGADGVTALTAADLQPSMELADEAPLAERLAHLRHTQLLVRVQHAGGDSVLRLRPDRLWLLAGLDGADGEFVQQSNWYLQRVPGWRGVAPAADAPHCAAWLYLREAEGRLWSHPVWFDPDLLARIALTPIVLAIELTLGPGVAQLVDSLSGRTRKPLPPGPGARQR
jgi:hypothetical protein